MSNDLLGANVKRKYHYNSCFFSVCGYASLIFVIFAKRVLLFENTEGAHNLRCSLSFVPAVHGAPRYRPPARTSGTGAGASRLTTCWCTVRTCTVCGVGRNGRRHDLVHEVGYLDDEDCGVDHGGRR
jgi:hypothetical protein